MYNEYISLYCEHYNLEIKPSKQKSYLYDQNNLVGFFKTNEKIIHFLNGSSFRKGDLLLSIFENTKLH